MPYLATPLDEALGSTSKIRLLRLLLEQDRAVTAREAARLTGMSATAILGAIEDLAALGLIERERVGRQFHCRINPRHDLVRTALKPLFATEGEWRHRLIHAIRRGLQAPRGRVAEAAAPDVVAAWVYGSVAQGLDGPGSDLDLFVLTSSDAASRRTLDQLLDHSTTWRRELGADVRPIVMSKPKALAQQRAGNPLIRNAVRDAKLVLGEIPEELTRG